ncbi:SEL1-like repeat protein [Pseudoalteromonas sp. BDTF-M6]|uniref:SEL1-like repeat protein n=1 Tax=Pseudoalteromonas sp. BDTF-M6 TaxID=2796132 RepID=UPI001BAFD87A|nr:SEL1-like repeat protein [Pseudoalteromonas sp. BDTF-M6]MBS3799344.1 sel1 repeat family protein [Pseudoalteromonas sp. BDTF-M6]
MAIGISNAAQLRPTNLNRHAGDYSLLHLGPLPLIPLGLPRNGVKHWLLWLSYHSLAVWLLLLVGSYFYHQQQEQKVQQQSILSAPEVYDVYLVDQQQLFQALGESARPGFKVLQVNAVDEAQISVKVGAVSYQNRNGVSKAIRMDNLMQNGYFATQPLTLSRAALADYFATGALYAAHRPNHIYINGGIVRPLPKPKPLYSGVKLNKANQRGIEYYRQGAWQEALAAFKEGADQGDSWAQYNLGDMYQKGHGVNEDLKQACLWFVKAAQQDHAQAQAALAHCD